MNKTITQLVKETYALKKNIAKKTNNLRREASATNSSSQTNEYHAQDLDLILERYYNRQILSEVIENLNSDLAIKLEELTNLLVLLNVQPGKTIFTNEISDNGSTISVWLQQDPHTGYSVGTSY